MSILYPPLSVETLSLAWRFRLIAMEELVPRHFNRQAGIITHHSDGSLVSEADLAVEKRLIEATKITHPHALATGEEEISEDPRAFLRAVKKKDVWIFDPLDGTGRFLAGFDEYAEMGAYVRNGVTEAAIIYIPGYATQNKDGTFMVHKDMTFVAERGRGCWIYYGTNTQHAVQVKIGKRPTSLKDDARVAFACRNQDAHYQQKLEEGVPHVLERFHANHDYARILLGESDATFYAEGFMPNTRVGKCPPWDHAAGVLMVEEAGGYAALPYGNVNGGGVKYSPLQCHSSLLVAANRELFGDMMRHLDNRAPELRLVR